MKPQTAGFKNIAIIGYIIYDLATTKLVEPQDGYPLKAATAHQDHHEKPIDTDYTPLDISISSAILPQMRLFVINSIKSLIY